MVSRSTWTLWERTSCEVWPTHALQSCMCSRSHRYAHFEQWSHAGSLEHMICKGKEACESFKPKLQFLGQCTEKQRGQLNERLPGGSGLEFERPNKDALWQVYIVRDLEGLHECLCGQLKYLFEDELTAIFGEFSLIKTILQTNKVKIFRNEAVESQAEYFLFWLFKDFWKDANAVENSL